MDKFDFFWKTMELCNWDFQGQDEKVLEPLIKFLSEQRDEDIFLFDDMMSELLYELDTKKLAEQSIQADEYFSDDAFLYSRCVALINGSEYYNEVKKGIHKEIWEMEFESLLYVPQSAWELKHDEEYPHITPKSYETGSNSNEWKDL